MLWVKSFHLIFMVTWFAGLFYLPRLFVYHAMSDDQLSRDRFKIMEKKLYFGIATPGGILTIIFGLWTMFYSGTNAYTGQWWLYLKLVLVAMLVVYHVYCAKLLYDFRHDRNKHSHIWYRFFNEVPVIFLIGIVLLAVLRPF